MYPNYVNFGNLFYLCDNSQPPSSSQFVDDDSEFKEILTKQNSITQGNLNDSIWELNLLSKNRILGVSVIRMLHQDKKISNF